MTCHTIRKPMRGGAASYRPPTNPDSPLPEPSMAAIAAVYLAVGFVIGTMAGPFVAEVRAILIAIRAWP